MDTAKPDQSVERANPHITGKRKLPPLQRFPLLRSAVEALTRGMRVKRRLPNGTAIYLSPDSQLKYLGRRFDQDLIALAAERVTPDSVVWDIGANCGVFAFSSRAARQVVAVEADPFLCSLMQDSIALNGVPLVLVSAAISSDASLAEFSIAKRGRASNHLTMARGRSQTGGERGRILVPTLTLDDLLGAVEPPTLVKIDVEGAEIEALTGARELLGRVRPALYLETEVSTYFDCKRILSEARYTMARAAGGNWLCLPE